jgi:acetyl esterase/lipase
MSEEQWKARFRAPVATLPEYARAAPDRSIFCSNASGTWEFYAWDRRSGSTRQVTRQRYGTDLAAIDSSGEWIWWFANPDGDEFGRWMRCPFDGGDSEQAAPELGDCYAKGIALGPGGLAVIGCGDAGGVSTVCVCRPGARPAVVYKYESSAHVGALSRDGNLISVGHSEHGDSRHMALRVIRTDGSTVADLWDGPGRGLGSGEFSPVATDSRLLVSHERHGRDGLLIWDPVGGGVEEIDVGLPGEIDADWFTDGQALIVSHHHHARDELYRYDLRTRTLADLGIPAGTVHGAAARPDGSVEYAWNSAEHPPVIRSTTRDVVMAPPGPPAPPSVPAADTWVDGPAGPIHVLIQTPEGRPRPHPTLLDIHGGPATHISDSFSPTAAAWVDHGFAVVRPNYRGSTGYGTAWRDAVTDHVGLTELEDIKAVRDWAVATGLADPARLVIAGGSWGGYLSLLGLGVWPDAWSAGIAVMPIADYVAAYEDETEDLKAFDRSLFGGAPEDVPERYRQSSPISYVDRVRAPVLIMTGDNDPRCPVRQISNYVRSLAETGIPCEFFRYDAGHGSLVVEEKISQREKEFAFLTKYGLTAGVARETR